MTKSKDIQLTNYFKSSEFNYIEPEVKLLRVLEILRIQTKCPIIIIGSARTVPEHIQVYKKKYKENWLEEIPWNSRHLPKFGTKLRAVDFKAVKVKNPKGEVTYYTGVEIFELLKVICKRLDVFFGCGIDKYSVHFDVNRDHNVEWYYY